MRSGPVSIVLACVASVAFVAWRVHAMHGAGTVDHIAVLGDASLSYTAGCASVAGSAEDGLLTTRVTRGSTLTVLMTGDAESANEPRELARYVVPASRRVIEDRHANERRRSEILRDLVTKCGFVRPTRISPVLMGVREAISGLRGLGCKSGSHCELRVASDLEENAEPGFKTALDDRHGAPRRILGEKVENDGIEVVFCGLASTGGGTKDSLRLRARRNLRDSSREDRLQEIWLSVFTNPEGVRFEPFCRNWGDSAQTREQALYRY